MANLVVVSKVKKFIKDNTDLSTSANFIDKISSELENELKHGIETAQGQKRKTVMGRDLTLYKDGEKADTVLVVASKVKSYIKDTSGLSTSSQVFDQLTFWVENKCKEAAENAKKDGRKTVMDRDLH